MKAVVMKRKAKSMVVRTRAETLAKSSSRRGLKAVCINLDRRPDRWEMVQKSFGKQAPWLSISRLSAVDGAKKPPAKRDVAFEWSTERLAGLFHWYRTKTITMSPGERGCCGSHLAAWRLAAAGKTPLVVLEDDAVASATFTATIEKALAEAPRGVDAVWLTSMDRARRTRFGEVLMNPSFVWTTVGYIIWPSGAKKLIDLLPMDMPVDNFMAWHIKQGALKAFSVKVSAVRQAAAWNVGSDVPHSDDIAMWNSPEFAGKD